MNSKIFALGHYAPERVVTNKEIERRLSLDAGWVKRRTGIEERRYAADGEALSDMAIAAGEMALAGVGFDRSRIGLVVLATSTPDHLLPPSAPLVAQRLGLEGAGAIDMAGACAGFLYAFSFADGFVRATQKPALVIAANILSRRTDFADRNTSVLFGDGAGAVMLVPEEGKRRVGLLGQHLASMGSGYELIQINAGGSRAPFGETTRPEDMKMRIRDGKAVFARASKLMVSCSEKALATAGVEASDVQHFVPHQANARMMAVVAGDLKTPGDALISSVETHGNSSAATIPLTLSLANSSGREFAPGDHLLMCAAGAGLTAGALVYRF